MTESRTAPREHNLLETSVTKKTIVYLAMQVTLLCSSCSGGTALAPPPKPIAGKPPMPSEHADHLTPATQQTATAPAEPMSVSAYDPVGSTPNAGPTKGQQLNRYARDVGAHRAAWEKRDERDYVLVVDMPGTGRSYGEAGLRVVVRAGRPVTAEGLRYGLLIDRARAPTMATVYDEAERAARSGDKGVPLRFKVQYDESHDVVMLLDAQGRGSIAEDHTWLNVYCYSTNTDGCRVRELSPLQCGALDGLVARDGKCQLKSAGRVAGGGSCCLKSEAPISDTACQNGGGEVRWDCERGELLLGRTDSPGQKCCRAFLMDGP